MSKSKACISCCISIIFFINLCVIGCSSNVETNAISTVKVSEITGLFYETKEESGLTIPEKQYSGYVIVVGNTANEPVPSVSQEVIPYLNSIFLFDGISTNTTRPKLVLVSAAGYSNHEVYDIASLELSDAMVNGSELRNQNISKQNIGVINEVIGTPATTSHLDFFSAMKEGVKYLSGIEGNKLMIVMGSGLNDVGYLNFASSPDLINQDPKTTANWIVSDPNSGVSKETLLDYDVYFFGLGNTVQPQPALELEGVNSCNNLWEVYDELAWALGANNVFVEKTTYINSVSPETSYIVNPVLFYEDSPIDWNTGCDQRTVIDMHFTEGSLTFPPDSWIPEDKKAAIEALRPTADDINANDNIQVTIIGYSASTAKRLELDTSELTTKRAQTVYNILVNDLGVDPSKIVEVRGAGTGHFVDEFPNGVYDNSIAAMNRVVVVTGTVGQTND
ncbi:MAG: OmpA family protein [Coriobacteriia bacterium]|nr:OmpA family protein [Coriobacteriia bacterium]